MNSLKAKKVTQWMEANISNIAHVCSLQCQADVRAGRQPFDFEWPPYSPDMSPMDFCMYYFFILVPPDQANSFVAFSVRFSKSGCLYFCNHNCPLKPAIFVVLCQVTTTWR